MNQPAGFVCVRCGKKHEFNSYVAAHARVALIHSCDCGADHNILNYRVIVIGRVAVGKSRIAETYPEAA